MEKEQDKKPVILCASCEESLGTESNATSDGIVCNDCFEEYTACNDCSLNFDRNSVMYLENADVDVCRECFENSDHFNCDDCGRYFTQSAYGSDGMCDNCFDGNRGNGNITFRDIDLETKDFQSSGSGNIITSNRLFGIELEMVNKQSEELRKLSTSLDKKIGVSQDGSIRGGFGIEIQTPILKGKCGEELLCNIVKQAKSCGFAVNKTCGTHCHLDAKDFIPIPRTKKTGYFGRIGELEGEMFACLIDTGIKEQQDFYSGLVSPRSFKIDGVTYSKKSTLPTMEFDNRGKIINKSIFATDEMFEKADYSLNFILSRFIQSSQLITKPSGNLQLKAKDLYLVVLDTNYSHPETKESMLGFYNVNHYDTKDINKIKALMAFYLVFDDVILSMLPEERRENMFCRPFKEAYSLYHILSIESYEEFEKLWYSYNAKRGTNGGRDQTKISDRKQDKHDSTRYVGTNFHSMLSKNKTLEIRYHAGTLDEKKILSWVALHQKIMDSISEGKISIDDIKKSNLKLRFENKLADFLRLLSLDEKLTAYVQGRIKNYNK